MYQYWSVLSVRYNNKWVTQKNKMSDPLCVNKISVTARTCLFNYSSSGMRGNEDPFAISKGPSEVNSDDLPF